MTEGSSVYSLVIWGVCVEGAQLHELKMVTHLEHWPYLEFWGVRCFLLFVGMENLLVVMAMFWFFSMTVTSFTANSELAAKLSWETEHPQYCSDLVLEDFCLCPTLKEHYSGCHLPAVKMTSVIRWLTQQGHMFCVSWMNKLNVCCDKCLNCHGGEIWRISDTFLMFC